MPRSKRKKRRHFGNVFRGAPEQCGRGGGEGRTSCGWSARRSDGQRGRRFSADDQLRPAEFSPSLVTPFHSLFAPDLLLPICPNHSTLFTAPTALCSPSYYKPQLVLPGKNLPRIPCKRSFLILHLALVSCSSRRASTIT